MITKEEYLRLRRDKIRQDRKNRKSVTLVVVVLLGYVLTMYGFGFSGIYVALPAIAVIFLTVAFIPDPDRYAVNYHIEQREIIKEALGISDQEWDAS